MGNRGERAAMYTAKRSRAFRRFAHFYILYCFGKGTRAQLYTRHSGYTAAPAGHRTRYSNVLSCPACPPARLRAERRETLAQ